MKALPKPASPYNAGYAVGYKDRHQLKIGDYDGWQNHQWSDWIRGWREGQEQARADARAGKHPPMQYEERWAPGEARTRKGPGVEVSVMPVGIRRVVG